MLDAFDKYKQIACTGLKPLCNQSPAKLIPTLNLWTMLSSHILCYFNGWYWVYSKNCGYNEFYMHWRSPHNNADNNWEAGPKSQAQQFALHLTSPVGVPALSINPLPFIIVSSNMDSCYCGSTNYAMSSPPSEFMHEKRDGSSTLLSSYVLS